MGIIRTDIFKCLPKYLYFYLLKSLNFREEIKLLTQGANINNISSTINMIKIPLPFIEEQQKIVDELDGYRRVIDGARKVINSYTPRLPKFDDCTTVQLGDTSLFDIQSGGTPDSKNANYWNGDINWITLADLPSENYITEIKDSVRKITQNGLDNSNAKLLPIGTVVVSSRATIGRIGIVRTPLATNQGFKNIIIKKPNVIMPEFLALILKQKVSEMEYLASGATFKEISKSNFQKIKIEIPSLNIQKEILSSINEELKLIDSSKKLIELFSTKIENRVKEVWGE